MFLKSSDPVVNYKDLMALVQLTHRAGPSVRLIVCKRVRKHLHLNLLTQYKLYILNPSFIRRAASVYVYSAA